MFAETLRLAVAVLGNAASVSLYAGPIVTFRSVIRKKSTEEFSCIPYMIGLLNSLLFTWYGLPVVSNKWENFPVVTVNGVGVVLEFSYIVIYLLYSSPKTKVKVAVISTFVVAVFCITAAVSVFALHESRRRKLLVGSIGLCVSVALYGSPLVAMNKVIKTKSVEFMPLPLSLCAFSASVLWLGYGILIRDVFVAGSSVVGTPLSILQLVIYFKYRKERVVDEDEIEDLEKGGLELAKVVELELDLGKEEKIVTNCEQL